jgi:hypothetical protein
VGWVLFRAADLGQAASLLQAMFSWSRLPMAYALSLQFNPWDLGILACAAVVFVMPADFSVYRSLVNSARPRPTMAAIVLMVFMLPLCGLLIVSSPAAPFIYFRF